MKKSAIRMVFVLAIISLALTLTAQVTVSGRVTGNDAPNGIVGANITLVSDNNEYGTQSTENGNFTINNVQGTAAGIEYELIITAAGYQEHTSDRVVRQQNLNVGIIRIDEEAWAPRNLQVTESATRDTMNLVWRTPEPIYGTEQWMHWDSGQNDGNAIGTGGAVQFIVAARFTPEQLLEADATGLFVTSVRFFPNVANATYTIRVYRGGSAGPFNPGQQVASQVARNIVNQQWNVVDLDEPVRILPEQEIWFGYHVNTPGGHPAGCDPGPAVNNFGNVMFFNNAWTVLTALNPDLNYNWNIQAYAGFGRGDRSVAINPNIPDNTEEYSFEAAEGSLTENLQLTLNNDNSRQTRIADRAIRPNNYRELEGYEVYRFNIDDEDEPEEWTRIAAIEDTFFVDTAWGDLEAGYYKYAVRSEYTNDVFSDFVVSRTFSQGLRFNLTGRVMASDTNEGLEGAEITFSGLEEFETESGENGHFTIRDILGDLDPTEYILSIGMRGYQRHTREIEVTTENVNVGNIVLNEMAYPANSVVAEINEDDEVDVAWNTPIPGIEQWLSWDSGENSDGIGANEAVQFQVAHRFTPGDLTELDATGLFVTSVKFFPREATATYTVKVWRGGGITPANPGQELASQVATDVVNEQWNEVILDEPVRIEPNQELWFGYHINTPTGFPAGCDAGPHVHQKGNMVQWNNVWQTMVDLNPQLTNNWNIQAYAGYARGDRSRTLAFDGDTGSDQAKTETPLTLASSYNASLDLASNHGVFPTENWRPRRLTKRMNPADAVSYRVLEGYDVYRLDYQDIDDPDEWEFLASGEDTTYTDTDWEELPPGAYRYAVVVEYSNDVYSNPAFSNLVLKDMHCFVTVRVTSNSGDPVEGTVVTLTNIDGNPNHVYSDVATENGVVVLNDVWRGVYTVEARLPGFEHYVENNVDVNQTVFVHDIELIEDLREVVNLQHELYNNNNVRLEWQAPGSVIATERWIHWDSGNNSDGIGTGTATQFVVAARFTPANFNMLDINGLHLTAVKFFPMVAGASYTIKVWRGGSTNPLNPGEEVLSQQVREFTNSAWNTVQLDNTVEIIEDQEIWFGYHINTPGGHPAGCDAGPAVNNFGNLMYIGDQWTTLISLNPALTNNWNIQAYAGQPNREGEVLISRNRLEQTVRTENEDKTRALLGYKVMRDNNVLVENLQELTYRDTSLPIGNYVYHVIAQYTTGESDPVSTEEVVILSADDEQNVLPLVTKLQGNYPNPFNPDTRIAFSLAADDNIRIEIFNLKGQKVRSLVDDYYEKGTHNVVWDGKNDNRVEVGSGIYFYRMESGSYSTTRKMIMMK